MNAVDWVLIAICVIALFVGLWPVAIIAAIIWVTQHQRKAKKSAREKLKEEIKTELRNGQPVTRAPTPGSSAHYEAWKAERERNKES